MKRVTCLMLLAWFAVFGASYGKDLQIERIENGTIDPPGLLSDADCLVGNSNGVYYAIPNWIYGAETYAFLLDPMDTCGCDAGFDLSALHMIVQFGEEDVPTNFTAYAQISGTAWNSDTGRWEPGPAVCTGPETVIEIETAGLHDVTLPLSSCGCMEMVHSYAISYTFVDFLSSQPDLVTDNQPTAGTSWNDYGLGWFDLVSDFAYPGNIIIWAEADCCETPVSDEAMSWGELKSRYR